VINKNSREIYEKENSQKQNHILLWFKKRQKDRFSDDGPAIIAHRYNGKGPLASQVIGFNLVNLALS
jgi:hypothetical protein